MPQEQREMEIIKPDLIYLSTGEQIVLTGSTYMQVPTMEQEIELEDRKVRESAKQSLLILGGLAIGSFGYFGNTDALPQWAEIAIGTSISIIPSLSFFVHRLKKIRG